MATLNQKAYSNSVKSGQFNNAYEVSIVEAVSVEYKDQNGDVFKEDLNLKLKNNNTGKVYDIKPINIMRRKKNNEGIYEDAEAWDYKKFYELVLLVSHATKRDPNDFMRVAEYPCEVYNMDTKQKETVNKRQYVELIKTTGQQPIGACLTFIERYKNKLVDAFTARDVYKDSADGRFFKQETLDAPRNVWAKDYNNDNRNLEFNVSMFYDIASGKAYRELFDTETGEPIEAEAKAVKDWVVKQQAKTSNVEAKLSGEKYSEYLKKQVTYRYERAGLPKPEASMFQHANLLNDNNSNNSNAIIDDIDDIDDIEI